MHVNPTVAALLNGLNNPSLPGIDLSLERMGQLLDKLGNPQDKLPPVIHIAGTNGKGSTLAFLRAIYETSGYRVHSYTSPHLVRFNERIILSGAEISDVYLEQLLLQVTEAVHEIPVTFFEATTALAFLAFAEHSADVVLLETGLGGRLDATNVVAKPVATIITPIDYDHMEFLGTTLGEIAAEKAGIIKQNVPCFIGEQKPEAREVLKRKVREKRAPLFFYGREWSYAASATEITVLCDTREWTLPLPSLTGAHQYHNAALASVVAQSLERLPVIEKALQAITNTSWPARLQHLTQGPLVAAWGKRGAVMLDGGHNASAALRLAAWVEEQEQPVTLLIGMMKRKNAAAFFVPFKSKLAQVITVPIPSNECYAPEALTVAAQEAGLTNLHPAQDINEAAQMLASTEKGTLLIAGSLFLAGELLKNHS